MRLVFLPTDDWGMASVLDGTFLHFRCLITHQKVGLSLSEGYE